MKWYLTIKCDEKKPFLAVMPQFMFDIEKTTL